MTFPRYPVYKDSGSEWLGMVPAHWHVDRIKASLKSCRNGIWGEEPSGGDEDITCVRVADFDRVELRVIDAPPTIRSVPQNDRISRILERGNLLIEKSGGGDGQPVGCVVLYDSSEPAVCSNFVARIELRDGMVPSFWRYLHFAAYSVGLTKRAINQTSGLQNLDQERYFNERAAYPSETEQVSIANFLDEKTRKLDSLIAEQQRLIELMQEKRQAIISRAVTRGVNAGVALKASDIEWIGRVPRHWIRTPLMWLTDPQRPIMYGIVLPGPDVGEGVPIVKGGNVRPSRLNLESLAWTTPEIEAPYARARLNGGDLVYSIRGSIGDCEIVPEHLSGANITQDVARIAPAANICARWLRWVLLSKAMRELLARDSAGAAVRGINIFDLKRAMVMTPPPSEQTQIADHLDAETSKIDALIDEATKTISLLRERRAVLILTAVTGQIDVRNYDRISAIPSAAPRSRPSAALLAP